MRKILYVIPLCRRLRGNTKLHEMSILRAAGLVVLLVLAAMVARWLFRDGHRIAALVSILALGAYLTWPPGFIALDQDCAPEDLVYKASASMHGRRFWREQLDALTKERHQIEFKAYFPGKEREEWIAACSHVARVKSEQG